MMCWIEDLLDFWFPEPVQAVSDVTREKPSTDDWYAPLPEPPDFLRAEPAVAEAEKLVRSRR